LLIYQRTVKTNKTLFQFEKLFFYPDYQYFHHYDKHFTTIYNNFFICSFNFFFKCKLNKLTHASRRRDVLFGSSKSNGFSQRTHAPRITGFEHQLVCQIVFKPTNFHGRFFRVVLFWRAVVAHASPKYPKNEKLHT